MRISYRLDSGEWSNSQLVDGLKAGDQEAFAHIYRIYWHKVFMVAYRKTKSRETAEELVQNLFVNLWNKHEKLQINQLENYLFTCIKNAVIRHYESQVVEQKYLDYQKHLPVSHDRHTEETISLNELNSALEDGLLKLPEKSRTIFKLSRFENRSTHEIATELNVSEKVVEYHITKSLKLLRHLLKDFAALLPPILACWIL